MINEFLTSTYLPCVCPQTTFCCKPFAANVAMKRPVLEPLNLRLVVPGVKHEYNVLFSSIFLFIIDAGYLRCCCRLDNWMNARPHSGT